jgi:hypothetical protein
MHERALLRHARTDDPATARSTAHSAAARRAHAHLLADACTRACPCMRITDANFGIASAEMLRGVNLELCQRSRNAANLRHAKATWQ